MQILSICDSSDIAFYMPESHKCLRAEHAMNCPSLLYEEFLNLLFKTVVITDGCRISLPYWKEELVLSPYHLEQCLISEMYSQIETRWPKVSMLELSYDKSLNELFVFNCITVAGE